MAAMYVSTLTLTKVGKRLRADATIVNGGDAVVHVRFRRPDGPLVDQDVTADKQGKISQLLPASWVTQAGKGYCAVICSVVKAGNNWDWTQGYRHLCGVIWQ